MTIIRHTCLIVGAMGLSLLTGYGRKEESGAGVTSSEGPELVLPSPREAQCAELQMEVPEMLRSLLRRQNIHRLFTHQAAAIDAVTGGKDVVIVTGTAMKWATRGFPWRER